MMMSGAWIFAMAAFVFAAGILVGWLLRGRSLGQSMMGCGQNIRNGQDDFTSVGPRSDSRADDLAAQRFGIANSAEPAQQASKAAAVQERAGDHAAISTVRNTFSLALGHRLAESARSGDPLSLILVRIDNYEAVRDRHGLQATNQILDAAGKFFIASVRGMDWVARFDMTTFALLLPKTAHTNALYVAQRLRTTVSSAALSKDKTPIPLTLSLGTTEAALGDSSETFLRRAEEALNASLRTGGNCIQSRECGKCETACAS